MGEYTNRRLSRIDLPERWSVRAGIELTDWAGDTLRVTDGGDGSAYMELGPFDLSVNADNVRALRDYLTEVLTFVEQ